MRIASLIYIRRRNGGDVEITFEDGSKLLIHPDIAVQFKLRLGMNVPTAQVEALRVAQEKLSARRRLMRYVAVRRKTVQEAERYLRKLEFGEEAVRAAVKAARKLGYLNDESYAEAFAVTQDRAKMGPQAIRQQLLARGVDKHVVEEAVIELDSPEAQRTRARQAAERRAAGIARTEPDSRKARMKLMQFLMRRGFDGEICDEIARELLKGTDE